MTGFTNFGEDKKKTKSLGPTPTSKRQMVTQKKRTFTNLALVKVHISLVGLQKKTVEPWPFDPQTLRGHLSLKKGHKSPSPKKKSRLELPGVWLFYFKKVVSVFALSSL